MLDLKTVLAQDLLLSFQNGLSVSELAEIYALRVDVVEAAIRKACEDATEGREAREKNDVLLGEVEDLKGSHTEVEEAAVAERARNAAHETNLKAQLACLERQLEQGRALVNELQALWKGNLCRM